MCRFPVFAVNSWLGLGVEVLGGIALGRDALLVRWAVLHMGAVVVAGASF
jgi:hypothetical protein